MNTLREQMQQITDNKIALVASEKAAKELALREQLERVLAEELQFVLSKIQEDLDHTERKFKYYAEFCIDSKQVKYMLGGFGYFLQNPKIYKLFEEYKERTGLDCHLEHIDVQDTEPDGEGNYWRIGEPAYEVSLIVSWK